MISLLRIVPRLSDQPAHSSRDRHVRRRRIRTGIGASAAALALTGLIVGAAASTQSSRASTTRIAATAELAESTGLRQDQLFVYPEAAKAHADGHAENALRDATVVMDGARAKVDVGSLEASVTSLANFEILDLDAVLSLTDETRTAAAAVDTPANCDANAMAFVLPLHSAAASHDTDKVVAGARRNALRVTTNLLVSLVVSIDTTDDASHTEGRDIFFFFL